MTKIFAVLAFVFCVFSLPEMKAQIASQKDKIPDDLLIVLKKQEGWGGTYSELTITASGDISYQSRGGLPVNRSSTLLYIGKNGKLPKFLKPKLSSENLKALIAEFEKIQFFRFGKDFPPQDDEIRDVISDQGSETILIRLTGQTKEVYNYLGDYGKRMRLLRSLAEKIRDAGVWNFEDGAIPENFQVRYQIIEGSEIQRDFKIEANGDVTETFYSRVSSKADKRKFVSLLKNSKVIAKVSPQQIKDLIGKLDESNFSAFKYSNLVENDGCSNMPASKATETRKHISVQINYPNMYASLYENCRAKPETDAARFEYAANSIEDLLKSVGVIKTK